MLGRGEAADGIRELMHGIEESIGRLQLNRHLDNPKNREVIRAAVVWIVKGVADGQLATSDSGIRVSSRRHLFAEVLKARQLSIEDLRRDGETLQSVFRFVDFLDQLPLRIIEQFRDPRVELGPLAHPDLLANHEAKRIVADFRP